MIQVLLAEDMRLMRGALVALLSREVDIKIVGEIEVGSVIVPMAVKLRPEVVVINTDLAAGLTFPIVGELAAKLPSCAQLILTDPRKPAMFVSMARLRSASFLVKDVPPVLLAETIRRVAKGERVIDPRIAIAALMENENPLTARELEVLQLAAEGASVPEIAGRLFLSLGTVRNYLSAVIAKTAARNRIDAIRIAREAGWLL